MVPVSFAFNDNDFIAIFVSQFKFFIFIFHGFDFDSQSTIKFYSVYSSFDRRWAQYQNDPDIVVNSFQATNKIAK